MPDFPRHAESLNKSSVGFVITDFDVGVTFIDVPDASSIV
jgi:hypothetical protein